MSSTLFLNLELCTTGVKRAEKNAVKRTVQEGGGTFNGVFTDQTTHLVASELSGAKCEAARDLGTPIVSVQWVVQSARALTLLATEDFAVMPPPPGGTLRVTTKKASSSPPQPLKGATLTMTNFKGPERRPLQAKIEKLGGTYSGGATLSIKYVVAAFDGGGKCDFARKSGIPIVTEAWLDECLRLGAIAETSVHVLSHSAPAANAAATAELTAARAAAAVAATFSQSPTQRSAEREAAAAAADAAPELRRQATVAQQQSERAWEQQLADVKARELQAASARERADATLRAREEEALRAAESPTSLEAEVLSQLTRGDVDAGLFLSGCRVVLWDVMGERRKVLTQLLCAAGATIHRCYYGEATHIVAVDDSAVRAVREAAIKQASSALGAATSHTVGASGGGFGGGASGAGGGNAGSTFFGVEWNGGASTPSGGGAGSSSSSYARRSALECYVAGAASLACNTTPALVSTAWVERSVTARRCISTAECAWRAIDDRTAAQAAAEAKAEALEKEAARAARASRNSSRSRSSSSSASASVSTSRSGTSGSGSGGRIFEGCAFFTHFGDDGAVAKAMARIPKLGGDVFDVVEGRAASDSARHFEVVPHGSIARGWRRAGGGSPASATAVSYHWVVWCAKQGFVEPTARGGGLARLFAPLSCTLPLSTMSDVKLSLSGIKGNLRRSTMQLAQALGATSTDALNRDATHLICTAESSGASGGVASAKYTKALEWNVPVVTSSWLDATARDGVRAPISEHALPSSSSGGGAGGRWSLERGSGASTAAAAALDISDGTSVHLKAVRAAMQVKPKAVRAAKSAATDDDEIAYADPESRRASDDGEVEVKKMNAPAPPVAMKKKKKQKKAAAKGKTKAKKKAPGSGSKRRAGKSAGKSSSSAAKRRKKGLRDADSPNVQRRSTRKRA